MHINIFSNCDTETIKSFINYILFFSASNIKLIKPGIYSNLNLTNKLGIIS